MKPEPGYTHIDAIDFSICEEIKKEKLFYNPMDEEYYKVWPENLTVWGRNIGATLLLAINSGYFDGIANIKSVLIADSGNCVGYITDKMEVFKDHDPRISSMRNKHGLYRIDPVTRQNQQYQDLFNRLLRNTEKTGFFFYDIVHLNLAEHDGRYHVIDFDSVMHLRDFPKLPEYHKGCSPQDYMGAIESIYHRKISCSNNGIDMNLIEKTWKMPSGGMNRTPYCGAVINGVHFEGERDWRMRWAKIKPALNWKGMKILDLGTCMGIVPAYLIKFCGVDIGTGVDFNPQHLAVSDSVRRSFRITPEKMPLLKIDLDTSGYEDQLGYDFDAIFCLSLFRWIKDQERIMSYMAFFKNIIFEAHDLDGDVAKRFSEKGFKSRLLGETRIGKTFSDKRQMYHFWKD